jgi:hypothetical protein
MAACASVLGIHDIALPEDAGGDSQSPCQSAPDAGSSPADLFCSQEGGVCWRNPAPQGATLTSAWGTCSNVWAVGQGGTIMHWDGARWSLVPSGTIADFEAVGGSGPRDVWIVGGASTALHSVDNGATWTPTAVPGGAGQRALRGVWAVSPADAWIYGTDTAPPGVSTGVVFMHWDGSKWSDVPLPMVNGAALDSIMAVWASSPQDLWVGVNAGAGSSVGADKPVLHWNGSSWNTYELGTSDAGIGNPGPSTLWGSSPDDVWAGAFDGAYHFTGGSWTTVPGLPAGMEVVGVWGTASDDVWFLLSGVISGAGTEALYHWNGTALSQAHVTLDQYFNNALAGWSPSRNEAFIVGFDGLLLHGLSGNWESVRSGWQEAVFAIYALEGGDVWIGGVGIDLKPTLRRWDGSAFHPVNSLPSTCTSSTGSPFNPTKVSGIWGDGRSPSQGIWVVGGQCAFDFDPNSLNWSSTFVPLSSGGHSVSAVWGMAQNDVWAVGDGPSIAHWDGTAWSAQPIPLTLPDAGGGSLPSFVAINGSATNDVWAVGGDMMGNGLALHWNGTSWTSASIGGAVENLTGVVSHGPTDAWAVGNQLWHWDGTAWSASALPSSPGAVQNYGGPPALWSSAADATGDLWLVSPSGLFERLAGSMSWQLAAGDLGEVSTITGEPSVLGTGYSVWLGGVGPLWTFSP